MPQRFPLFAKILCWFLLNLALLAIGGWIIVAQQMRLGFDSILVGRAGDRVRIIGELALRELNETQPDQWNGIMEKFSATYPLEFRLVSHDGTLVAGKPLTLPHEVTERLAEIRVPRGQPPPRGRDSREPHDPRDPGGDFNPRNGPPGGPPPRPRDLPDDAQQGGPPDRAHRPGEGPGARPNPAQPAQAQIAAFLHAGDPKRYWLILHAPLQRRMPGLPTMLVLTSDSLSAGGLIFDYAPFLWAAAAALVFSILFWVPLIRSITRSIGAMRDATVAIADGRFDARVNARRRDELGTLGAAINAMSERLAGLLNGQRRFLSDIAHELCAPLSRLQVALGILEARAPEADRDRLLDLREEIDHMSDLVNELLSFSRAALQSRQVELRNVSVREVFDKVVRREASGDSRVETVCPDELLVKADPDLLQRALGNLLRNALRYAGDAGTITLQAEARAGEVQIEVLDCGPGVPEKSLPNLFDPFFRLDTSRTRETGGVGLGLTIARTCLEACRGKISARNRTPSGLCVSISLEQGSPT